MAAVVWLDEISKSVPLRDMLRQSSVALTTAQCFVNAIHSIVRTNTERTEEGIRHAPPPDPSVFMA